MFPVRPKNVEQKIDGAIAAIMALLACSTTPLDESTTESVYEHQDIFYV